MQYWAGTPDIIPYDDFALRRASVGYQMPLPDPKEALRGEHKALINRLSHAIAAQNKAASNIGMLLSALDNVHAELMQAAGNVAEISGKLQAMSVKI